MKQTSLSREQGLALLRKYNKEPFHILHGLTVEGVMEWYAEQLGYGDEKAFWGMAGLLHDIDFELYPEEHCERAPELLRDGGAEEDLVHAVVSHGYGIRVDVAPEHEMEKVLAIMPNGKTGAPCGACRELMVQLMPDDYQKIEIMLDYETRKTVTLGELTPEWWI